MNPFVGYDNLVPLLAPVDLASTATDCPYMDLRTALEAAFLVSLGNIASGSADTAVITVEAATAEGGTEAAIAFKYRLSGAVGDNTWGAVSSSTTTEGVTIGLSDDGKLLWIELDVDTMAASEYRYARVVYTDSDDMVAFVMGVVGFIRPRYKQTTFVSATASASA